MTTSELHESLNEAYKILARAWILAAAGRPSSSIAGAMCYIRNQMDEAVRDTFEDPAGQAGPELNSPAAGSSAG